MTQAVLPRKPSSEADKRTPYAAMSDLLDKAIRTPEVQHKTFTIVAGDYPLHMNTTVKNVQGVYVAGLWLDSNPSSAVYCTGVSWSLGKNDGDVDVLGLNGLTAGVKYRIRIKIEGVSK